MKKLLLILLLCLQPYADIAGWDTTGLRYALSASALFFGKNIPSHNSGTTPVYQGNSATSTRIATLTNTLSGYGYLNNGYYNFDATNDYIDVNDTLALTNTSDYTVEFWLMYTHDDWTRMYTHYVDADTYYTIYTDGSKHMRARYVDGASVRTTQPTDTIPVGLLHVVVVKNGATTSIYQNGSEVSAYTTQQTYILGDLTMVDLRVGQDQDGTNPMPYKTYFMATYDIALSAGTIADNYALGKRYNGLRGVDNGDGTMSFLPFSADTIEDVGFRHVSYAMSFGSMYNYSSQDTGVFPTWEYGPKEILTIHNAGSDATKGFVFADRASYFQCDNTSPAYLVSDFKIILTNECYYTMAIRFRSYDATGAKGIYSVTAGGGAYMYAYQSNQLIAFSVTGNSITNTTNSTNQMPTTEKDVTLYVCKWGSAMRLFLYDDVLDGEMTYSPADTYDAGTIDLTSADFLVGALDNASSIYPMEDNRIYWFMIFEDTLTTTQMQDYHDLGVNLNLWATDKGDSSFTFSGLPTTTNNLKKKYWPWGSTWMEWSKRFRKHNQ